MKNGTMLLHTFAFSFLHRGSWATTWVLLITEALKEDALVFKWASIFVKLYSFSLSIGPRHPYIEIIPTFSDTI